LYILFALFPFIVVLLFWRNNLLSSGILVLGLVVFYPIWFDKVGLKIFLFCTIGGAVTEIVCIKSGIWYYMNPTWLIPLWLPFVWGYAGIAIVNFYKFLES